MEQVKNQDEQIVSPPKKADLAYGMDRCTPSAPTNTQVTKIPLYRNTARDAYQLGDGTEVAIYYPQAIRSSDEEAD